MLQTPGVGEAFEKRAYPEYIVVYTPDVASSTSGGVAEAAATGEPEDASKWRDVAKKSATTRHEEHPHPYDLRSPLIKVERGLCRRGREDAVPLGENDVLALADMVAEEKSFVSSNSFASSEFFHQNPCGAGFIQLWTIVQKMLKNDDSKPSLDEKATKHKLADLMDWLSGSIRGLI